MSYLPSMLRGVVFIVTPNKVILLLFFMCSTVLSAQDFLYFSGKVISGQTQEALEKTLLEVNGESYIIDSKAEFSIYVIPHDTITFRHLGYTPFAIVVSDAMVSADLPSVIPLQVENITLEEFTVKSNVLTEEMKRNAQRHVQQAVQQALQKNDGMTNDPNYYRESEKYSGLSTSQMFGADLVKIVGVIKKPKKEAPKAPTMKIISYEEYRSSMKANEKQDTTLIGH